MGVIVAKFGGTSLCDAGQFRKVRQIVLADPRRRYIVPSAPGRRSSADRKITDLLYLCHAQSGDEREFQAVYEEIAGRYRGIVSELGLALDLEPHLAQIAARILSGAPADYAASRGEYLCGLILSELLGFAFVDAAEVIRFDAEGALDVARTREALERTFARHERAVIPGFYGAVPDGGIRTFPRGGSDITGAVVARFAGAEIYENWTDVPGFLMADPAVVRDPRPIEVITYRELRELAYMGALVLHEEAIFPVREAGIPIHLRNTNDPGTAGTMIVREAPPNAHGAITGIAGRRDFSVIALEKALMNTELGFGRKLLAVLEKYGISFEHMPSGIDTISVVIADSQLDGKLPAVLEEIRRACRPDALEVYPNMALIATVGRGMARTPGIAAKLFAALAGAGINVRMIDQGSSEINIIVGVETEDFERAVRAIYGAFVA
ncbi:MAG: aspartate kinase [Patescibacteria group bacterium]